MSEEAAADVGTEQQAQPEPTLEEVARAMGYKGKDELKDPEKYISPAEFIKRTAKFKDDYQKELRSVKQSVRAISDNFRNQSQAQYERGVRDAEAAMAVAKEQQDVEAYEAAREQRDSLKAAIPAALPPEIDDFVERNPWFEKNKAMTADALSYKERFIKANPGADLADVLEYVESKIKKDYPEKFAFAEKKDEEKEQRPASGVESGRGDGKGLAAWQKDEKLLTPFEKSFMDEICKAQHNGKPAMTKQQYIEGLRAQGALEGRR